MSQEELIAKQALRIAELEEENENLKEIVGAVHMKLICIGAPLNDNYYRYTDEQLQIFFDIEKLVAG